MNKFLLWSGIAILAITSCAKDQTIAVNNGHAIGFTAAAETKATELYAYQLSTFYCTAVDATGANYFTNVGFVRSGEFFSSSPAYFWPVDGSKLSFWAYAPAVDGATATINNTVQQISGFKPALKWEDQVDFITATAEGSKENDESSRVNLPFEHRLAQISIHARNQNEEYVYKVKGYRIVNALTNGTYSFEDHSWTFDDVSPEKATYSTELSEPVTLEYNYNELTQKRVEVENGYDYVYNTAMIIPQTFTAWDPAGDSGNDNGGAYLSIAIQVTTKAGDRIFPDEEEGDFGYVATPLSTELTSGYEHRIYLDFTKGAGYLDPEFDETESGGPALGETIKYTLRVNPWNLPEEGEILRRQLEGSWKADYIVEEFIYPEGVPESEKKESFEYRNPERVKDYFGGNGFYEFTVDNNYVIHMVTPEGLKGESSMTVDDEGNIYLEAFKDDRYVKGYSIIPVIQEVNDAEHTAITYIDNTNSDEWYETTDEGQVRHDYQYIRRQIFHYNKF